MYVPQFFSYSSHAHTSSCDVAIANTSKVRTRKSLRVGKFTRVEKRKRTSEEKKSIEREKEEENHGQMVVLI